MCVGRGREAGRKRGEGRQGVTGKGREIKKEGRRPGGREGWREGRTDGRRERMKADH